MHFTNAFARCGAPACKRKSAEAFSYSRSCGTRGKHSPHLRCNMGRISGPGSGNFTTTRHHFSRRTVRLFVMNFEPRVRTKRLLPIGSPRFDAYIADAQKKAERQKESSTLTILSNTPTMDINERYGTYSTEEYFRFMMRLGAYRMHTCLLRRARRQCARIFFEEARARGLAGVNYESVGTTPLTELFRRADIFVCSYPTVVYEALI